MGLPNAEFGYILFTSINSTHADIVRIKQNLVSVLSQLKTFMQDVLEMCTSCKSVKNLMQESFTQYFNLVCATQLSTQERQVDSENSEQ